MFWLNVQTSPKPIDFVRDDYANITKVGSAAVS